MAFTLRPEAQEAFVRRRDRMWLCAKKTPLTPGVVLERGRGMETVRRDRCRSPDNRGRGLGLITESQGRQQEVIGFWICVEGRANRIYKGFHTG